MVATAMKAPPLPLWRMPRVRYDRLVEVGIFGPEDRIELLDGLLVVREPQGGRHATVVALVRAALEKAFGRSYYVREEKPIALDERSEPEPDVVVVPGRPRDYLDAHPSRPVLVVEVAETSLALDRLRKGGVYARAGITDPPEREAIGVDPKRRGAFIDEALPLLRRLWAGETVSHEGATGSFRDVELSPLPVQQPLEVWLGGTVPAALERCGRLSDGWLPSLCTPDEAAAGRVVIEEAAAKAGRSISSEHFGVSIGYAVAPIDPATARTMTARRPRALELTPVGLPALRERIERFIAVGFSKFVVRPVVAPPSWRAELEALAAAVGDLQT